MLDTLVTTATGALSATVGVLVGSIVSHRAQDRRWLRDRQLAVYEEVLSHYAKFTVVINRAHADGRGWDYDWREWSAALTRASPVAPAEVTTDARPTARTLLITGAAGVGKTSATDAVGALLGDAGTPNALSTWTGCASPGHRPRPPPSMGWPGAVRAATGIRRRSAPS